MKKIVWLSVGFSLLVLLSAVLIILRSSSDNRSIPCMEGFSTDMSPSEVSEFVDIPLVTLSELPDGVLSEPQVTVDVEYPLESPVCGLKVIYLDSRDMRTYVVIEVLNSTHTPVISDWSCLDYELNSPTAATDMESGCSTILTREGGNLFIRVSSRYLSEETRIIVNNIVINETS